MPAAFFPRSIYLHIDPNNGLQETDRKQHIRLNQRNLDPFFSSLSESTINVLGAGPLTHVLFCILTYAYPPMTHWIPCADQRPDASFSSFLPYENQGSVLLTIYLGENT